MAVITIDKEACTGCSICVNKCPEAYDIDDDMKAIVKNHNAPCAQEGADDCPVGAIEITGEIVAEAAPAPATPAPAPVAQAIGDHRGVMVFAEQRGGELKKVTIELLGRGRGLADDLGVELSAALLGHNVEGLAKELIARGADKVYLIQDPRLENFNTGGYAKAMSKLIRETKPEIALYGATHIGRDLAPRIARQLHTGLTADCTELTIDLEQRLLLQHYTASVAVS